MYHCLSLAGRIHKMIPAYTMWDCTSAYVIVAPHPSAMIDDIVTPVAIPWSYGIQTHGDITYYIIIIYIAKSQKLTVVIDKAKMW